MQVIQRDTAIILHPSNPQLTLTIDGQIPTVTTPERHFWQTCDSVNNTIFDIYGIQVIVIRPLSTEFVQIDDDHAEIQNIYLTRYLGGIYPDNGQWVALETVREIDEIDSPAWYRHDFYETLQDWLQSFGTYQLKQIRSWERSAIWHLTTATQSIYAKVIPDMFAHEIPLTHWLKEQYPNSLPDLIERQQSNLLLTLDYGTQSLDTVSDISKWQEAIRLYAQIQVDCIDRTSRLLELGVPHRGLDWIEHHLSKFLADDTHFQRGSMLTLEEIQQLRDALPHFEKAIAQLQASNMPETLEHGDLWAGQIIITGDNVLLTDWSDSAITFPLFGLMFFLADIEQTLPNADQPAQKITDAYLLAWDDTIGKNQIETILTATTIVTHLYIALRYHHDILPNMTQHWEMENMIPYEMRLLLSKVNAPQ